MCLTVQTHKPPITLQHFFPFMLTKDKFNNTMPEALQTQIPRKQTLSFSTVMIIIFL